MLRILNEEKYVSELLEKGKFIDKRRGEALYLIAKHYRFKENLSPIETKAKLIQFCHRAMNNYYSSDFYKNVNKSIVRAYNDKAFFIEIDNISIYQSEINYIQNLNISNEDKRLLFVLMCITKITQLTITRDNTNYWTSNDPKFRNLKKISNFTSKYDIYEGLHRLILNKLITVSDYKNTIQLVCMKDMSVIDNDEMMLLNDFNNIGYWWDKFILDNKNIIRCTCCQQLIKRRSNRQVMCKDCSVELTKEYKAIWYQGKKKIF